MKKKFYIHSAIPYVNAAPHIGHALEFIQTNTIARYHRLLGRDVITLCGGDENALKNVQAAEKAGEPIQEFIDKNNNLFVSLTKRLNCAYDIWQKGSDQKHHYPSSQKLWNLCMASGDIYEKSYEGLYCIGCETFYTSEELNENGECFEHPGKKLEKVKEKNYFFRLSKYQKRITDILTGRDKEFSLEIVPQKRKNEVLAFLSRGLEDISISRSNERAKNWGVPVPHDPSQRMYVWFDALNIYQSGIGLGWDDEQYKQTWPADIYVIGKGITRFHAVYWPAFLLSAGLLLPKTLFVHEYFTVNGQKMSKTLGNVIDPNMLIDKYGTDPLRYYFLAKFSPFSDGDFSEDEFKKTYNSDLANGLGNLVARVARLCDQDNLGWVGSSSFENLKKSKDTKDFFTHMDAFEFNLALEKIWALIKTVDGQMEQTKPWSLTADKRKNDLLSYVEKILQIATLLESFMPSTAQKIIKQFTTKMIKSDAPLFPRLS